ncbi:MAG: diguanylate cyclase, partial [Gemmatimonadetes bacterium]|nr:diguanylate cyclase [Gemmatimonadota bacterium]
MERVILRHLKGSKTGTTEEFPLASVSELTLGRDPIAQVRFDADKDDLVGRQHARIVRDPNDPVRFTLTDLNSRNGTFLNNDRLSDVRPLAIGDKVKLGTTTVMRMSLAGEPEAHYAREMFRAALRDGLTGAFNRRYFDERLEAEVAFAKRHHSPLALILVDFDHFKRINDDYG